MRHGVLRGAASLALVSALGCAHGPLWRSAEYRSRTVGLWRELASRYASRTIVAGYDLLNEPIPDRAEQLLALDRDIVQAIRQVDRNHLVIVEGTSFATDFSAFRAPLDDNQAYSFHLYTWFGQDPVKAVRALQAAAGAQSVPFWNGEYGENSYEEVAKTLTAIRGAEHVGLSGAAYWTWKQVLPRGMPVLAGIQTSERWRQLITWAAKGGDPPMVREEALAAMDEFLADTRIERCSVDDRMASILRPRQAGPAWPGRGGGFVRQRGDRLVDGAGRELILEGVDLGGWLTWEAWIWGAPISIFHLKELAHTRVANQLETLVGDTAERDFEARVYREFVRPEDLERIAALGFNVVRVPVSARSLARGGWEVLDNLLDAAERAGVYVILDLHAAPGGQSPYFIADPA